MRTRHTIAEVRELIAAWKHAGETIAFVPTMGNLHDGHLSLFEAARATCPGKDIKLVASVFVNPLQFGKGEDFDTYPRTLEQDSEQLEQLGVDLLFAPSVNEMYPNGQALQTRVIPPDIGEILEGECRPGFFTGVATVVNKLFNMVLPDVAVFGEKDFQQLMVIRRMVADLGMPVRIVSASTVREADGLAMSSRNAYLSADQRPIAAKLNLCLDHLISELKQGTDCQYAVMHAMREIENMGFMVDYVVIRRRQDLGVPVKGDRELVALVAAKLGTTRLIDNKSFDLS